MNSIVVLILGFIVFYVGYKFYAGYIDTNVIKADPKRVFRQALRGAL
jgi:carbon starvation protein CstA